MSKVYWKGLDSVWEVSVVQEGNPASAVVMLITLHMLIQTEHVVNLLMFLLICSDIACLAGNLQFLSSRPVCLFMLVVYTAFT